MWFLRYMAFLVLGCTFLASPALAREHANKDIKFEKANQKLGHREKGLKYLQLESFMAPALYPGRSRPGSFPVTVILNVPEEDKVGAICRVTPRIRDAIMMSLFTKPIPIRRGKAEMDGTSVQLLDAINKSLGSNMVSKVIIMAGVRSMGKGAVMNLPFSSSGCAEVKKMEAEKKKKEKKK